MKKITLLLLLVIMLFSLCACSLSKQTCLRIHIRANDNTKEAQAIKLVVRDAVVKYLTPFLHEATTAEKAKAIALSHVEELECIANEILANNGLNYTATAKLSSEFFPTRVYNNVTFSAGVYDALILELGTGAGDNWWCVVYPPLCFIGGNGNANGIVYKSKLLEIINEWLENKR